jgi:alpha-tubulin suppressor-like RCC1 family protein
MRDDMMSAEGKRGRRCGLPGPFLPVLALLFLCHAACNLAIGLDREKLPEKVDEPCETNEDCDDHRGCTQDVCQLEQGSCTHFLMSPGAECHPKPAENVCDVEAEVCDGRSPDCPADVLEPSSLVCRPADGVCDEPENCTGESPLCPEDRFSSTDKVCDDGDECTHDDTCDGAGGCEGINGLHGVKAISAGPGAFFTCALMDAGGLRCWGNNNYGQLGDGTNERKVIPTTVEGLPEGDPIVQLAAGGRHVNVLLESGTIMAWGLGDTGQLGNGQEGDNYEEHAPVAVKWNPTDENAALGWRHVASGYLYNCAIQDDDTVWCWGKNDYGQLVADPSTVDWVNVPRQVTELTDTSTLVAGNYHACAVDDAGAVMCWGWNNHGQLGNPAAANPSPVPVSVEGLPGRVTDIALGILHTCALLEDKSVWCWGVNNYGQLGNGGSDESTAPVEVSTLPRTALDIDSEYEHTCALLEGGEMMCWGHNDYGQIGDGTSGDSKSVPVSVAGLPSAVVSMAVGALHACALLENSTVWCWGNNAMAELGIGFVSDEGSPVPVEVNCR